jgi:thiosulfate dehydrogenase [quinone] large subunit
VPLTPRPSGPPGPERRLPFQAPVRAWVLSEWALLPLRVFMGATFIYAGLQKLANPNFFQWASPISIKAQLIAAAHTSPIHALLVPLEGIAKPIGLIIAFGELAVGIGTLLGLWSRVAAIGGILLSLMLFLTVSYHASPYFTGADIVFFFAWMPFIISGGGARLSFDAWIANRVARKGERPSPEMVPIPFATVQAICGNYSEGTCSARAGLACDAAVCPVLLGGRAPLATRVSIDSIDRRALVVGGMSAAVVGAGALLLGGAAVDAGRMVNNAPKPPKTNQLSLGTTPTTIPATTPTTTPTNTTPTTVPAGTSTTATGSESGKLLGAASQIPDNNSAAFTIPSSGDPGIVIHTDKGEFVGYNAVCPHMGCTVGYSSQSKIIVCPCHGSEFKVSNGDVIAGPAPHGLEKLKIVEGANGNLYLQ